MASMSAKLEREMAAHNEAKQQVDNLQSKLNEFQRLVSTNILIIKLLTKHTDCYTSTWHGTGFCSQIQNRGFNATHQLELTHNLM